MAQFTRFGRTALIVLAVIVCAGFLIRAWAVVNPLENPGDDAFAYRALAEALYVDGTFGYEEGSSSGPEFKTPSDWSPGAPLIYAAAYYLTGGVRDGVARGVEAVFGTAAILLAFLLTARLLGPPRPDRSRTQKSGIVPDKRVVDELSLRQAAGPLLAAAMVAFYPPFIHSTGALMSEPPAIFMLPAAILAFLWADRRSQESTGDWSRIWPWLLPGLCFGLVALIRPEYMAVCAAFGLLLLVRAWMKIGPRTALPALIAFGLAVLVPIVPWTIHNYNQLDRMVPISTGSGKALFTGTYYPGDGEYQQVKAELYFDQTGRRLDKNSDELEEIDPKPLFTQVANEYRRENNLMELDRDAALGRLGRENLEKYFKADPLGYVGMTFRKVGRMWGSGIGEAMSSPVGRAVQILLVLAGLAGLILLARRRRWETIVMALPIVTVTAIAALTLAPPRRNEILMMLVLPLAAVAFDALVNRKPSESTPDTT